MERGRCGRALRALLAAAWPAVLGACEAEKAAPPPPIRIDLPSPTPAPPPAEGGAPVPSPTVQPSVLPPAATASFPEPPPAVAPADPRDDRAAAARSANDLPGDLLRAVREQVLGLPEFYRNLCLTPDERLRAEGLVGLGKGRPEDVAFLQSLAASPKVRFAREEWAWIAENRKRLEKEALDALPADEVKLRDGRTIVGRIVEKSAELVRVERRPAGGVAGTVNVPRGEILAIGRGQGPGAEFRDRWEKARSGSAQDLLALMEWCKVKRLTLQARLVAFTLLSAQPEHPKAREEAELPPDPVRRALEAIDQGGFISYENRTWTPRELRDRLLKDGYVLFDGAWYTRKDRLIAVPNLFAYEEASEKAVSISAENGAGIAHDADIVWRSSPDPQTGQVRYATDLQIKRRFYTIPLVVTTQRDMLRSEIGPAREVWYDVDRAKTSPGTELYGEVLLSIPLEEVILEGSVQAVAEVKDGASIAMCLLHQGRRVKLYTATSRDESYHRLPDLVRGMRALDFVAEIRMRAAYVKKVERRPIQKLRRDPQGTVQGKDVEVVHERLVPDYAAVLFPSTPRGGDVFRLRLVVGVPAEGLTALFRNVGALHVLR